MCVSTDHKLKKLTILKKKIKKHPNLHFVEPNLVQQGVCHDSSASNSGQSGVDDNPCFSRIDTLPAKNVSVLYFPGGLLAETDELTNQETFLVARSRPKNYPPVQVGPGGAESTRCNTHK